MIRPSHPAKDGWDFSSQCAKKPVELEILQKNGAGALLLSRTIFVCCKLKVIKIDCLESIPVSGLIKDFSVINLINKSGLIGFFVTLIGLFPGIAAADQGALLGVLLAPIFESMGSIVRTLFLLVVGVQLLLSVAMVGWSVYLNVKTGFDAKAAAVISLFVIACLVVVNPFLSNFWSGMAIAVAVVNITGVLLLPSKLKQVEKIVLTTMMFTIGLVGFLSF
ncbi:hypothetical protein [Parachitinimonas caeni]|uniref:Yip1 domain-containing protein n=1 Tax=Parachitinimonas caeni TaxID=3031301 RepID=A0ABT7E3I2_9NEIS|nr:hypothetical protein [Parachitinimonas caeni]MDK2126876.1 hypothetical protein [Parachitinimonas caeni]